MPTKDLHSEPFDSATITKLDIFENYAKQWIPTFVMIPSTREMHVFDFFAGTGYDKIGQKGSPIRILDQIKNQVGNIFQKKVKITIHFNEFEPNKSEQIKYESLKNSCHGYLKDNDDVNRAIDIKFYNEDCETLFPKLIPLIREYPSLVYLDQNGIKFLSDSYLLELEKCKQTDFLYFVSSSYFWRFGNKQAFKKHFDMDLEDAKRDPYRLIHKNLLKQLLKRLPDQSDLRLYPYSIKKETNIYGIIFGASHPRAVQKFLTTVWKKDGVNGEANFDIYDNIEPAQKSLFPEQSKLDVFKELVEKKVVSGELLSNFDLYAFTLSQGHIGKHSREVLMRLKREKRIFFEGNSPLLTYDKVYNYKKKKLIKYELI